MPRCYNCGCDIPADDKLKLCDNCKKIILPFIKFMDASTSSAVRRLVSNEKNLRKAGVTDGGMEYLMRVCDLHDRQKQREREERDAARAASQRAAEQKAAREELTDTYLERELPLDEPLRLHREPYGKFLSVVQYALILLGAAAFLLEIILGETIQIPVLLCSLGLIGVAYVVSAIRPLLHDLEEIKKRFR